MQMATGLMSGFTGAGGGAGDGGGASSGVLAGLRLGTSAVSALSTYAMSQQQSAALQQESADEALAARGEYVQAQQKSNAINLQFNKTVGAQLADASAGGIDIGSGSVIEAGRQAEQARDRAITATQTTAQINASIRTARANMLARSADMTATTGVLSGIADLAKGGLQYASVGGYQGVPALPGGD